MHIRKLPSGNWNVMAYAGQDEDGKNIVKSFTGPDKELLKMQAQTWEYEHRGLKSSGTFRREASAYLKRVGPVLSPSTLRGYKNIKKALDGFPALSNAPLHRIDARLLQEVVGKMDCSPKTIKNRMAFVSTVLKSKGYRMPVVRLPQVPVPDLNIPDPEVVKETLAKAEGELWIVLMLAATGPLRQGEIAALTMDDIDARRNIVHVHHSLVGGSDGKYTVKAPKTAASDRYVVMPPELIQAIVKQGYVTTWTPKQIQNKFHWHLHKYHIPPYRFHDLRHFCISELLSQGIEEIYIAERSGHSDYASLKKYTHALAAHRKDVNDRVLSHFSSFV